MIRTIKQRIYLVGLLPLALLAVALVVLNGISRINDANRELTNAQNMTVALLHSPAMDALEIGNTLNFEKTVTDVIKTSPSLVCVTLADANRRLVSKIGECEGALPKIIYFTITRPADGLSDFPEAQNITPVLGAVGLVMNEESVVHRRHQVIFQLALSLILIAAVLGLTGRLLRRRLVTPIHRIGDAMHALSQRDYNARVPVEGADELTKLSEAINSTIATIEAYTRELERRRSDADRALQDADEANLARDGLVRSLTEDLEEPLSQMHSQLTAIAMANTDAALKQRIKAAIALLQEAQSNFADLIEIAASAQRDRKPAWRDLADILSDIQRDIALLSKTEGTSIQFGIAQTPLADAGSGKPTGIYLDVDGIRLKKAVIYLVRAMSRRCKDPGVYVNAELIRISADELHVSVHLKAFYGPGLESPVKPWLEALNPDSNRLPAVVGLTDLETRVIDYLLRAIGITPAVNVSPTGSVTILLDTTCHYTVEKAGRNISTDWMSAARPISAVMVSNDTSLMRLTTRGDVSNHELKLMPFSAALANPSDLREYDALLIDMSDDIGKVISLIDLLKEEGAALPNLIAICPPGRLSDSLIERLLQLGFAGTIQKPLQYSRIIEVLRTTLSSPLKRITRTDQPDKP